MLRTDAAITGSPPRGNKDVEAAGQDNFGAQCDRQTTIVQALREEGEWCNAGQSRPDLVMFTEQSLLYFHTHVTSSYDLA